jgi:hypothetical protein
VATHGHTALYVALGPCSLHADCVADPMHVGTECKRRRVQSEELVEADCAPPALEVQALAEELRGPHR